MLKAQSNWVGRGKKENKRRKRVEAVRLKTGRSIATTLLLFLLRKSKRKRASQRFYSFTELQKPSWNKARM